MPRRTRFLVPLLVLPLAACGTTVPTSALTATSTGDGLTAPVAGNDAGSAAGVPDGTTSLRATPLAGGRRPTSNGSSPALEPGDVVAPTDRTPVRVGVLYVDGADTFASSLGISGLSTGDSWAQAKAVVAHLDATGGLAGHPIDLRQGKVDAARAASDPDGAYAAVCSSLVEDQQVRYVVSYVNLTPSRLDCYAKHGVVLLDDQSAIPDSAGTRYSATFAGPGDLSLGRAATQLVDDLWRRGWLTPVSKVGTLVPDTADGAEIETRFLVPALRRHGVTAAVKLRSTGVDPANQNANVIKLRSAGVDRVIPLDQSPLFLMNAAESQGYRPAYALNSGFGPGALLETAAPKNQLKDAAGIGWSKYLDIGAGRKPGPVSSNETLCFALMAKAGQQSSSGTTQAFQVALCNVLMFLKSATDRYGVVPGLLDRVRSSGLPFLPADAYGIHLVPGRPDGVSEYRDLAYEQACSCFQYVSGNRPTG